MKNEIFNTSGMKQQKPNLKRISLQELFGTEEAMRDAIFYNLKLNSIKNNQNK